MEYLNNACSLLAQHDACEVQEVASVWVPVPGSDGSRGTDASTGSQTSHAFAPRTQWLQFSAAETMSTRSPRKLEKMIFL